LISRAPRRPPCETPPRCELDARDARLIRLFATAVYHLPFEDAVARIAPLTSASSVTRLATSVRIARWLTETAFPTVQPLQVDQPVISHGCVVTFWRYLPQEGPAPDPADLAFLLRQLHQLGPPRFLWLPTSRLFPFAGPSRRAG
jgi:hypothetical protein